MSAAPQAASGPRPSDFSGAQHYRPARVVEYRGVLLPEFLTDPLAEYKAARDHAAVVDRSDRALIVVTGRDRKSWLHNLVTNQVKNLDDGAGSYAFAIDVRGRVHFDLNILNRADELWLDLDRAEVRGALAHLDRYLISEDVRLRDASDEFARLGVSGAECGHVAAALGASNGIAMAALSVAQLSGDALLVRHDFAGVPGFELIIPRQAAPAWWERITALNAVPAGLAAIDVLRIEARLPWPGRDLDDKVIPPETMQVERGISYHKGCYLGQEVIERMRSHNVLARRLVRLRCADSAGAPLPSPLVSDGKEIGRVTSLIPDLRGAWIGLGYVRTSVTDFSGISIGPSGPAVKILDTP